MPCITDWWDFFLFKQNPPQTTSAQDMEAGLFTMDKGEGPLLCPCIASGLLIPVSTMADDLPFTPQLDQDGTALISLPFRQSDSYYVQMKGEDPLHIKDCIKLMALSGKYCARNKRLLELHRADREKVLPQDRCP